MDFPWQSCGETSHFQMPVVRSAALWQKTSRQTKETVQRCNHNCPLLVQDQAKGTRGVCYQPIILVGIYPLQTSKKPGIKNSLERRVPPCNSVPTFPYYEPKLGLWSHLRIHWNYKIVQMSGCGIHILICLLFGWPLFQLCSDVV